MRFSSFYEKFLFPFKFAETIPRRFRVTKENTAAALSLFLTRAKLSFCGFESGWWTTDFSLELKLTPGSERNETGERFHSYFHLRMSRTKRRRTPKSCSLWKLNNTWKDILSLTILLHIQCLILNWFSAILLRTFVEMDYEDSALNTTFIKIKLKNNWMLLE